MAFFVAVALVFIRCSSIHELLTYTFNTRPYLVAAVTPLAILLVVFTGGLGRAFKGSPAWYWLGVLIWLTAASAVSTWRLGSAQLIVDYARVEWILLPIIAGSVRTWREFVVMARAVALAAAVTVAISFQFRDTGRLSVQFGIMANSNDIAAHLIYVLPFVLYFFMTAQGRPLRRMLTLAVLLAGVYVIFATASRGALIAIAVMLLFCFRRASMSGRLVMIIGAAGIALALAATLQSGALKRLSTLFRDDASEEMQEAVGSAEARKGLLLSSLRMTAQHPVFGVGPGQFSEVHGRQLRGVGIRGVWQVTHNAYTQFSSEAGIPALLLVLAALFSTYRMLNRTWREAGGTNAAAIRKAAFCLTLSLIGFSTSVMFLSLAYRFYLPALSGLAIALSSASSREQLHSRSAC